MRSIKLIVHNFQRKLSNVRVFLDESLGRKSFRFSQLLIKTFFRTQHISIIHLIASEYCSVTHLRRHQSVTVNSYVVEYSFLFPLVQKVKKSHREMRELLSVL